MTIDLPIPRAPLVSDIRELYVHCVITQTLSSPTVTPHMPQISRPQPSTPPLLCHLPFLPHLVHLNYTQSPMILL